MANLFITTLVAACIMMAMILVSVVLTMPFIGSLIRLRANYNPRAIGLEGSENHVGPKLNGIWPTLKRTYRLEGYYGLYKGWFAMISMMSLIFITSVIFVGGMATKGPKGTWIVPSHGGIRMALFTISMTFISLPMHVIVNRAVITPYRLPNNIRQSLQILLSPHELSHPLTLYKTPGLLAITFIHVFAGGVVGYFAKWLVLGGKTTKDQMVDVAAWRFAILLMFQVGSALWMSPIQVVQTKLTVQPNLGYEISVEDPDAGTPEGLRFAGTEEDVVGLRPTSDPYMGVVDATRKIIDEEGWQALYRGWWWTSIGGLMAL